MKNIFLLFFYKDCLKETLRKKDNGEQYLELAHRFFKFKVYKLSK